MGLLDYHAKNMMPAVWTPDGDLSVRFTSQLSDQLKRFPGTKTVLLVGDAVSHYWQPDSDVDVLLLMSEDALKEAQEQAERASGYVLAETDNPVNFWPVRDSFSSSVLAKHFGPVYNVDTGAWYGEHVQDETELCRPSAVLRYANWRLWKAKRQYDPFPYEWRILSEAFMRLDENGRDDVITTVKYRVAQIDRNVRQLLKRQSKEIWRAAEAFDQELIETEELPSTVDQLPKPVVLALLHRLRYQDLLDILTDIDDLIRRNTWAGSRYAAAPQEKSLKTKTLKNMLDRFLQLSEMILQRMGGSASAVDVTDQLFNLVLENNRYIMTDMRRRRIVYRLYDKYYRGRGSGKKETQK